MSELTWMVTLVLSIEASFGMGLYFGYFWDKEKQQHNETIL